MSQNTNKRLAVNDQELAEAKPLPINRRILVVEDEPEIAKAYQHILIPEQMGNVVPLRRSSRTTADENQHLPPQLQIPPYELTVAHSAAEAFHYVEQALVEKRPFAIAFVDVLLGAGIDGIELVKKIQQVDQEMFFVFVTAYQDRSVNSINELLGPEIAERWDYLNKPFSEGEILQKARNAVSHWNLRREKLMRDQTLSDLQTRIFASERMVSVATVARGMGHEFGNILLQIIGRADLAKYKPEADMRLALDQIITAGELAAKVLDRFKNLSKNTDGDPERNLIRAAQPLEDALLLMDHQLKISKIKVCKIKIDSCLTIGSCSSLTQVLVNLIINSIHVMKNGGQIDFSITRTPQWVELRVRDYGPGIEKSVLPQVTDAFFTTKGDEGTGLGLSICKEIVEVEHQGHFHIGNHNIKGVEVLIQLPLPTTKEQDL